MQLSGIIVVVFQPPKPNQMLQQVIITFTCLICPITESLSQSKYPNGQIKAERDSLTGIYTEYYENGDLKLVSKDSLFFRLIYDSWHENRQLKESNSKLCDSIVAHIQYFDKGQIKERGKLLILKPQPGRTAYTVVRTGRWHFYSPEGDSSILTYKRSPYKIMGHGDVESYYFNGQLESKGNYQNNLRNGIHTSFYEDGTLKSKIHYDMGITISSKFYFPSGIIDWTFFYDSKHVKKTIWHDHLGNTRTINLNDTLNKIKTEENFQSDGTLSSKTIEDYSKEYQHIQSFYYLDNGELEKTAVVEGNRRKNSLTYFNPEGKKTERTTFFKSGMVTKYVKKENGKVKRKVYLRRKNYWKQKEKQSDQ